MDDQPQTTDGEPRATDEGADDADAELDMARLAAEIHQEVRRRRATGDFPPGLERELDSLFARYAPATTGGDFQEVIERAERTSFVHADVPTASRQRVLGVAKRVLRSLMAFYLRFLAQQVTAFAGAISRAVRLLGQRVDRLEQVTVTANEHALAEIIGRRQPENLRPWLDTVSAGLTGIRGRVLHADCGDGALLARLVADGRDAYGIEPNEALAVTAAKAGLDVRADDMLTHLDAIPDGALQGLVVSGTIDLLPLGLVLRVADLAASKLDDRGSLVVISSGGPPADPVIADLAPGRPLHPQTWRHLLASRGFAEGDLSTQPDGSYALVTSRGR